MKVGIVGGGIMGVSLGYYLTQQGFDVALYEASPELAGLAGPLNLEDGTMVDRFYHAILSSDGNLRALCQELGIDDEMRFRQTRMGFYYNGRIYSMNNVVEFLRFPPLNLMGRFRLGMTVLAAQRVRDWRSLEQVSVEEWLLKWGGHNTYQNIWRPLLRAKFDGGFDNVSATWIWSRLVRMKSTRDGASQKEEAGHLIGGYPTLLKAMAAKICDTGGEIHLSTPVQEVVVANGCVVGLRIDGAVVAFDRIVSTVQTPLLSRLLPEANAAYRARLNNQQYLGIICPLMVLERPLTGYWTINITDESIPFTGIIETTAYIDPQYVGGHHLVYLPKYTMPQSEWQQYSDAEIREIWLSNLQRMFPDFDPSTVRYFVVNRSRYVEPLHGLGGGARILEIKAPIDGLYLATTAQIYPDLTNGESVSRHAARVAQEIAGGAVMRSVVSDDLDFRETGIGAGRTSG